MTLLKTLDFHINVALPNEFIFVYSALLYPENESDIIKFSLRIVYDSFYTYANLIYKNYVIALSCIIIAAKFLNIPSIFDKNFKYIENMRSLFNPPSTEEEFNKKLLNFENKTINFSSMQENSSSYFDILEFHKKLHPNLELKDLYECIEMIIEFYEEMKQFA